MKRTHVIAWQNKITGEWGHGNPVPAELALSAVDFLNEDLPYIDHSALNGNQFFQWLKTKVTEEEAKSIYHKMWGHCYFA